LLKNRHYFRFEGKPMLLIDRIGQIPQAAAAMRDLRSALSQQGVTEIHIAAGWSELPEDGELPNDPAAMGLDAYYESPPHRLPKVPLRPLPAGLSDHFAAEVYDYNATVSAALGRLAGDDATTRHRGVMAGWDSAPRRKSPIEIYHGATPANFRRWLRGVVEHEASRPGERVIFINAWNAWGEGAYLEPDRDFGRGWLEAVASATGYGMSQQRANRAPR
jgi:hypothetical protein